MFSLFLSILCTSGVYLMFRIFTRYSITPLPAIAINYTVCAVCGLFFLGEPLPAYIQRQPSGEFWLVLVTGICFMLVFHLMGIATRLLGVAGGTIVSRMSMVIPATISVLFFGEYMGWEKAIGIALALVAIYFSVFRKKAKAGEEQQKQEHSKWYRDLMPLLAFLGVGLTDTQLKLAQRFFLHESPGKEYITILFFFSALTAYVMIPLAKIPYRSLVQRKNLVGGIVLGIINYFSLYFFFQALGKIEGSRIFPINSVGIVTVSSLVSIFFMGETVNLLKIIGLLLAVAAILLISGTVPLPF